MDRIRSLDGIRAISIIMVIMGHCIHTMPDWLSHNYLIGTISNSPLGVMVFFVISGYLITKLLLIEREVHGQISIKKFYTRRIFRIFPVFYIYILVVLILKYFFFPDIFTNYSTVLFAALYLWNYQHLLVGPGYMEGNGYWFFGHFWSLSMEEQFYLFWPVTFKFLNIKKLQKITLIIILTMPAIKLLTYFLMPGSRGQITMMLHTGGDTILVGCLGALLEKEIRFNALLNSIFKYNSIVIAAFVFLIFIDPILSQKFGGAYSILFGAFIKNFVIMFLIFWCIQIQSPVSNFLNKKFMVQVGIISYSLYIWQQLFLTNLNQSILNTFPYNIIVVFIVAFISYYLIEKPIMNLKNHPKIKKYILNTY